MATIPISRRARQLSYLADIAEYSARGIDRIIREVPNIPTTALARLQSDRDDLRQLAQAFSQQSGLPLPGDELDSGA